jgi:hypothetical protein
VIYSPPFRIGKVEGQFVKGRGSDFIGAVFGYKF